MKKYTIIALAFIASCSKAPKSANSNTFQLGTTCTCQYLEYPGHDTTVSYVLDTKSSITPDSQCAYHEAVLLSKTGVGGANCELQ